ncbi:MAG: hypothetical protein NZ958_03625 [Bacteroidia bacterium]|nr:hypothetical protein [Bacteroidia bacterium]MDW8088308.1 hypothetical protein [Bacteroidia bacterium]
MYGEMTQSWLILGRRLTVQGSPDNIRRVAALLEEIEARGAAYAQLQPQADELTHWLMGLLSVLDSLATQLHLYEAFTQRLEALLPPQFLSTESTKP